MTRLIDADRLKRSFEANTPIAFQDCVPGIHAVIDLEPTVDPVRHGKWIPCSERLPKIGQEVICQCRAGIIKVLKMDSDMDWFEDAEHCYMSGFVIAWMPLPEPYAERKEE